MFFPVLFGGNDEAACPLFSYSALPSESIWKDMQYSDGYFVACGSRQDGAAPTIAYSDDYGVTWNNGVGALSNTNLWDNITKLGSTWLSVAVNTTLGRVYQKSTDAINWTNGSLTGLSAQSDTCGRLTGLITDTVNSRFVMMLEVNDNQFGGNTFYASADGIAWTRYNLLPSTARWKSIACNDTHIVAISWNTSGSDYKAAYSPISTYRTNTWTASTLPTSSPADGWFHVIWTGTCFFATTKSTDTIGARSYDGGATWETVTLPHDMNDNPMCANTVTGKLFLVCNDLNNEPRKYFTSIDDGDTWTECAIIDGSWSVFATDGERHVVTSTGTTATWDDQVAYHIP